MTTVKGATSTEKSKTVRWVAVLVAGAWLVLVFPALAEKQTLLHETFEDLDGWEPLTFRGIEPHSSYTIEENGTDSFLRAQSNASASGLVRRESYDVSAYPVLSWRWKVDRVYDRGDAATKEGDDYPIRLYVVFEYDPGRASAWQKIKYESYKAVHGRYPPDSSLNYIWANRGHENEIIPNAYTERAMMILLRQGADKVGQWVAEQVNVVDDYRRAFGEDPPARASLAIMNDSDDTGEASVSWVDDIRVFR